MSKAKKKLKYAVIQSTDLEQFCKECNSVIEIGYSPLGGISSVVDIRNQSTVTYIQAFTYENNENS